MAQIYRHRVEFRGQVFERRAPRRYTHVVIFRVDHAEQVAAAVRVAGENWDREISEWTYAANSPQPEWLDGSLLQSWLDAQSDMRTRIAMGRDWYMAQRGRATMEFLARRSGKADLSSHWEVAAWAGSAIHAAAAARRNAHRGEILCLETTLETGVMQA